MFNKEDFELELQDLFIRWHTEFIFDTEKQFLSKIEIRSMFMREVEGIIFMEQYKDSPVL
jgi:hypothetical protein